LVGEPVRILCVLEEPRASEWQRAPDALDQTFPGRRPAVALTGGLEPLDCGERSVALGLALVGRYWSAELREELTQLAQRHAVVARIASVTQAWRHAGYDIGSLVGLVALVAVVVVAPSIDSDS
jgi:hypothetical protein